VAQEHPQQRPSQLRGGRRPLDRAIRDSKNPIRPAMIVTVAGWATFIAALRTDS
jgi:hypothetical protein